MNVSRLLFSVQILLTYPIECFVSREVIERSVFGTDPNVPMSQVMHYMLTLGIVAVTYFISITTYCLGVVLELNVSETNNHNNDSKILMLVAPKQSLVR